MTYKRAPHAEGYVGRGSKAPKRYDYRNTPRGGDAMKAWRGEPPATRGMHHPEVRPRGKGIMLSYLSALAPGGSAMGLNTTADIRLMNGLGVGTSDFQRSGQRIEMKSLRVTGQCQLLSSFTGTAAQSYGRLMVVYDRQPTGTLPNISDILADQDTAGTSTTNAFSGMNLQNRDRFAMLVDKRFEIPQVQVTAGVVTAGTAYPSAPCPDAGVLTFDEFRILKSLEARYLNTSSSPPAIGDLTSGAVYMITMATNNASGPSALS